MSEPKRAWIYGRISNSDKNELLSYQMELLENYAYEYNYAIVGSTRAFDLGKSMESYFMMYLINLFEGLIAVWSISELCDIENKKIFTILPSKDFFN